MRRRLPLVALLAAALAALSLGLAACGDDDDEAAEPPAATSAPATSAPSTTTAPEETTPAPAGGTVTVDADPSGQLLWVQKTLTAPAGPVTFEINNESSVPHNLAIQNGAQFGPSETVTAGSTTLEAELTPGTYTFYCEVPGHQQAGMEGTLTVE